MIVLAVIGGIVLLIGYWVMMAYNSLIRYRIESENAWSQIDVQLKRRHDLIPNLVETVKGVMQFERETLTKVMEARAKAMGAGSPSDRVKAENEISGCLSRLMAVWENYPQLKASQNAMQLQEELVTTENRIAYSRGHYNDISANYNAQIEQFPSNILANTFSFVKRSYLEVASEEKTAPEVKF